MINPVDLTICSPLKYNADHYKMDMYWQSDQWVLEPFENGRRYQCIFDENISFLSFFGNSINKKIPSIINYISDNIPKNSLVEGIITADKNVISILESKIEKSLKLQEENNLKFVIYDVIYWNNEKIYNYPLFDRRKILEKIKETNNIKISKNFIKDKYKTYLLLKNDYKGFYFRDLNSEYVFGKRSNRWRVFKEPQVFFGVILDVIEGKGQFTNTCGTLKIGQLKSGKMTYITNIGGISYDDRIRFYKDKKKFIGKVVEIKALQKTKKSYSEARFFKIRDDKTQQDCVFNENE